MKKVNIVQNILIGAGLFLLVFLPTLSIFVDIGYGAKGMLFIVSFTAAVLLMIIRPVADIFDEQRWLKKYIALRKGLGILSASIIVGFMIQSIIAPDSVYLASLLMARYYSLTNYALLAHIGDLSGLILLLTSNRWSQRILKGNWKRVQKLAYPYFYAGGLYEALYLNSAFAIFAMFVVTGLVLFAWTVKRLSRLKENQLAFE